MLKFIGPDQGALRPGPSKTRRASALRNTRATAVAITHEAEEILFTHAELMTEARVGAEGYSGSTMITIDLEAAGKHIRGLDSREDRERFVTIASGSVRLRMRAIRFACAEAARRVPERSFGTFNVDTTMRIDGMRMLVDVEVDAPFAELGLEQRG